jgi:hypothetical protein
MRDVCVNGTIATTAATVTSDNTTRHLFIQASSCREIVRRRRLADRSVPGPSDRRCILARKEIIGWVDERHPVAPWELRVGQLRVFYDVSEGTPATVRILAVGVKERNIVRIGGEEIQL